MVPEKPRICTGRSNTLLGRSSDRSGWWPCITLSIAVAHQLVGLRYVIGRSGNISLLAWALTLPLSPHLHDASYLHLQYSRLSQNASCSYRPSGLSLQTTAKCNYRTDRAVLVITNLAKFCLASIQPRLYYCVHSSRIYPWLAARG
jgi:hypothetical protein